MLSVRKLCVLIVLMVAPQAWASMPYILEQRADEAIKRMYPGEGSARFNGNCNTCHTAAPPALNGQFGADLKSVGMATGQMTLTQLEQAFMRVTTRDPDGDGETNEVEFKAGTNPNDANSKGGNGGAVDNNGGFNVGQGEGDDIFSSKADGRVMGGCGGGGASMSSQDASQPWLAGLLSLFLLLPLALNWHMRRK